MNRIVPIAVYGAAGRMGEAVLRLAFDEPRVAVVAAIVRAGSLQTGERLRDGLDYTTTLDASAAPQVLIDFSFADAFDDALAIARARRIAFVSGTTGLSQQQHAALRDAAGAIPVRTARSAARVWGCGTTSASS